MNPQLRTSVSPLSMQDDRLMVLDQTLLPGQEKYLPCTDEQEVAEAIRTMKVRGAPAIGIAGAYGLYLAARRIAAGGLDNGLRELRAAARVLNDSRPTAVNLSWAVNRVFGVVEKSASQGHEGEALTGEMATMALAEARLVEEEDRRMCQDMALAGLALLPPGDTPISILTHCNAGALATGGIGTALGLVRAVHAIGRLHTLYADETRPWLQGARLTTWECLKDGVPVVLQADGAAASLLKSGEVQMVVVGADRIAANGDTANKVGTLGLAIMARHYGIPMVVVAPSSTLDLSMSSGDQIPIEERGPDEVLNAGGRRITPDEGVTVRNPSFDVTPGDLVSAIVTEKGVYRAPFRLSSAPLAG